MTKDEAKIVFLNRGYVEVEGGTVYDPDKWREACIVISEWLEQQPILDKMVAEIEQMDFDFGDFYDHTSTIREMVLEVIDKYKVESEKKC